MASRKSWLWNPSIGIPRSTVHSRKKKISVTRSVSNEVLFSDVTQMDSEVRNYVVADIPQPDAEEIELPIEYSINGDFNIEINDTESGDDVDGADIVEDYSGNEHDSGNTNVHADGNNCFENLLDFTTLIECYLHRFQISDRAGEALLKLIKISFQLTDQQKAKVPESMYSLRQRNKTHEQFGTQLGWICQQCQTVCYNSFGERRTPSECTICPNCMITAETNDDYFVTVSLEKSLVYILKNNKTVRDTIYYGECHHDPSTIEDICCGKVRKDIGSHAVGRNDFLTLLFNTDGVPVFHSAKCSAWPILATITELPQIIRKNTVLCLGLWFGKEKPNFQIFLETFVQELKVLSTNGLTLISDGNERNIKVFCIGCLADSVARPILQNITQFNGQYGCQCCLNPGIVVPKKNGHMRAYNPEMEYALRTKSQHENHVNSASVNRIVYGVKGASILHSIPFFDVIDYVPIDYMHCVLLGVVRTFTKLWIDSGSSSCTFHLGRNKPTINYRMKNIYPHNMMARTPRTLEDIPFWKAHEWRSWLLFYSPVILKDLLAKEYFDHWCILSYAIHTLSRKEIKKTELQSCKALLKTFVCNVYKLYGIEHCSYNVHLLLHLCDAVERYGPLFGFSLFTFENFNQVLLASKTGTQAVPSQMVKHYISDVVLNAVKYEQTNPLAPLFENMMLSKKSITQKEKRFDLGEIGLTEENLMPLTLGKRIDAIVTYERLTIRHFTIHGRSYKRDLKRDSSTVFLYSGSVLCVEKFIEVRTSENNHICAVGNIYETVNPHLTESINFIGHIEKQCGPNTYTVVPISTIKEPAVVITCNNNIYYGKFPNFVEYRD